MIYSFGVGEDISFDIEAIHQFNARVYAFDPTPKAIAYIDTHALPEQFHFYNYGIAGENGTATFYAPLNPSHASYTTMQKPERGQDSITAPVYTLATIMEKTKRSSIDVLKMDIEGLEYDVLEEVTQNRTVIPQIVLEFHHFCGSSLFQTIEAVKGLEAAGYKLFHIKESHVFSFVHQSALSKT